MKKIFFTSLLLCSAQTVLAQTGEKVFASLNIPVSPRQAALGGDVISIYDNDVNFTAINPSLLNEEHDKMLSVNYAKYIGDTSYGTISFAKAYENGHLFSAFAKYMDYGKMTRTDVDGIEMGQFGAADAQVGLNYAYQFEDMWTVGGGISFINSKIDNFSSMAVGGIGAVTYHNEKRKETISLVARNFGYQFKTFNGTREQLPFRVDLGFTKILEQVPVAVSVSAVHLQQFDISSSYNVNGAKVNFGRKLADHLSFGVELFPEERFNVRLGYNVKRGNELAVLDQRNFSGLSGGFGIRIGSFRFEYAHVRYHNAANMNFFGINLDMIESFGGRRSE